MSTMAPDTPMPDPHVQVVRGTPDDVELAALVAGLAAAASSAPESGDDPAARAADAARARWMAPGRLRGGTPTARGADAWRWSLR